VAHLARLDAIEKASRGACLWLQLTTQRVDVAYG
jgi:hypothetical protein